MTALAPNLPLAEKYILITRLTLPKSPNVATVGAITRCSRTRECKRVVTWCYDGWCGIAEHYDSSCRQKQWRYIKMKWDLINVHTRYHFDELLQSILRQLLAELVISTVHMKFTPSSYFYTKCEWLEIFESWCGRHSEDVTGTKTHSDNKYVLAGSKKRCSDLHCGHRYTSRMTGTFWRPTIVQICAEHW